MQPLAKFKSSISTSPYYELSSDSIMFTCEPQANKTWHLFYLSSYADVHYVQCTCIILLHIKLSNNLYLLLLLFT